MQKSVDKLGTRFLLFFAGSHFATLKNLPKPRLCKERGFFIAKNIMSKKKDFGIKSEKKQHGLCKYSADLAISVCEKIGEGLSLRQIGKIDGMPSFNTILRWLTLHDDFVRMYNIAKEEQAELLADEIISIADKEMPLDVLGKIDGGAVNQARLQVEARKWVAARLKPKKYGESTTLRGDAEAPLIPTLNISISKE